MNFIDYLSLFFGIYSIIIGLSYMVVGIFIEQPANNILFLKAILATIFLTAGVGCIYSAFN